MQDDRAIVLSNVRSALAKRRQDRAPLPDWDESMVVALPQQDFASLEGQFQFKLEAAGGIFLRGWPALSEFLAQRSLTHGYVDPTLVQNLSQWPQGTRTEFVREEVDSYQFSVTRAAAGIAESGSIVLNEERTSSRLGALAPWVHIAVLKHPDLLATIPEAIARLGDDRATVFITGPSKTADVEGILIKGVHGPGVQVCCLV